MIVLGLTVLMQFSCQNLESFFAKEIPEISISAPPHALETKMAANVHRTLSYMKSSRLMSAFKVHRMHCASGISNKPDQKNKCHNLQNCANKNIKQPWNMVVGRRSFPQGAMFSFRETTIMQQSCNLLPLTWSSYWLHLAAELRTRVKHIMCAQFPQKKCI